MKYLFKVLKENEDDSVVVIEVNQVKTLGYFKYPILKEEDLLK